MHNFKFLAITETHLNSEIKDAEIAMPNYNVFREDRCSGAKGGGSAMYVDNSLPSVKLDWFDGSESIALKISLDQTCLYVVCLYRSPSLKTEEENEKLLSQISKIPTEGENNVIVMGDLNLPDVDWDLGIVRKPLNSVDKKYAIQSQYLDLFLAKGLKWFVQEEKTRIRKVNDNIQMSTLDQIMSNNEALVNSIQTNAPLGKSDHVSLLVELNLKINTDYVRSKSKNWFKVDEDFINNKSNEINWGFSSDDLSVESMWSEIYSKIQSISDQVPDRILKTNRNGDILGKLPWDTSKLVRKRKEKDQRWKEFDILPTMINFQTALSKQGEYQKFEFEAKVKYEKKIIRNSKSNSKPLFNYLRSKNKLRKTVSNLKSTDGNNSKTPKETAQILANFFQSVFQEEHYGPLTEDSYLSKHHINKIMEDLIILPRDVKQLLTEINMNKSMGPDDIHPKLLKFLASNDNFVKALTQLFNVCVKEESIPNIWKTAFVIPLHKKGSVHLAENYRPISLTCILCKIYEKLIRRHILYYVSDIISDNQHGFVSGKSCNSNLLETLDKVNDFLAEDNCADILYFDFLKAFDSVSHYRLLTKLQALGINSKFLNIIKNFLCERTMKVVVGDAQSKAVPVSSGVPQGSVLGPLLFLLFINDLPECVKNIVKLFADDVKMIVSPNNFREVQIDLCALSLWENKWLLRFNLEKCMVLHIGKSNPHHCYNFSGSILKSTEKEKDLGIIFNGKLNFEDAIRAFITKAKSCMFWFLRNTISRNPEVMKKGFNTVVRPHLEYCCQVWSPKARHGNWGLILEMEGVQRTFTRMIDGMDDLSYKERLQKLGLTTLLERRMRGDLIETFKILNGHNNYGIDFFNLSSRTNNLIARPGKINRFNFITERVLHFWNKLPQYVKDKDSINSFKNSLDAFRNNGIKNNLYGHFWELSNEIYMRI